MNLKMHRPAVTMNRIGAAVMDMFLISLLYGAIVALATGNYSAIANRFNVSFGDYRYDFTLAFVLMSAYFVILPLLWNGCTVGKKFTRTRLVKQNGEKAGFGTLVLRFISVLIPNMVLLGIPAIVNVYMMLFRRDNRGYHDLAVGTKVVSTI
ncbi:RDD family protein [Ectobacillus panaciterrae]|uniref:RDD family protein n=1 Tax=Ectobacillus panaciterrae TaxID=363872 RepID=UPI00040BDE98|nr:RDD family protein [Ectobacillus panaciterrae]